MSEIQLPSVHQLYNPVLQALHNLGGSGTNEEINLEVAQLLELSEEQLAASHDAPRENTSIVISRMNWARSHLKIAGLIINPRPGHWHLTEEGRKILQVGPRQVQSTVRQSRTKRENARQTMSMNVPPPQPSSAVALDDFLAEYTDWRDDLFATLNQLSDERLERFFLQLFKKEGITAVDVLDSSNPYEIEGVMKSGGFLTIRVDFKFIRSTGLCRWRDVDDFRQSVQNSGADKGVLMVSGAFSDEARGHVPRDSSRNIELIDGQQLVHRLKALGLGVRTIQATVEFDVIDSDWFAGL